MDIISSKDVKQNILPVNELRESLNLEYKPQKKTIILENIKEVTDATLDFTRKKSRNI